MKKIVLFSCFIGVLFLFASCANGTSDSEGPSISSEYNALFDEVLASSAEFAKQSIKACVPSRNSSRSAFRSVLVPSEEDKWEGRIQYSNGIGNWNVPSYYYGSLPGDSLVVNGEDFGELQDLDHIKDENGNYRKARFVYKDNVYYVFDKADYVPEDRYVVLGTADNVESIIFDQDGKYNSPEFSNFKFWVWERDLTDTLYRRGDLGYAYTLRNIKMQDGSYATVTVSGYNYYNYGFRVWIKECDGDDVKNEYPNNTPYSFTSTYQIKTMQQVTDNDYDFIYEIENKSGASLKVRNYMRDYSFWDNDHNVVAESVESDEHPEVTIPINGTYQFKYKLSELKALCPFGDSNVCMGCYFTPEGKWECWGWENSLNESGKKHTVIVTSSENSCMNGENSWSDLLVSND